MLTAYLMALRDNKFSETYIKQNFILAQISYISTATPSNNASVVHGNG